MKSVIESFGVVKDLPLVKWRAVTKHEDLKAFGFPCFLKADVVGHKTEMGAILKCNNLQEAEANLQKLHKIFPNNKIVIQETFNGIEMIVGVKADDVFGKILVVGFGGIFAEVQRDVSFRALPVDRRDVIQMIKDLRGVDVFRSRGKKYDMEKLVILIEKVAFLSDKIGIKELDLNPVIVGEKDSKIVDVRIELE